MCELCSNNKAEQNMAYDGQLMFANSLDRLAAHYRALGYRKIKPHSEEWTQQRALAQNIIRNLVNDWI